jgi:ribonuclease HII
MAERSTRGSKRLSDPFLFDTGFLASVGADEGDLRLAGADEAGRGSLAGPLVAAAVVLDYSQTPFAGLKGLTDSKLLTREHRERLYRDILCVAKRVAWNAVSAGTVDRRGLHRSNLAALAQVLETCGNGYAHALVDGFDLKRPDLRATALVRGDYKSAAVAAASVVAKVVRDRLMRSMAPLHPEYGFDVHVGYGTPVHLEALRVHGPCRLHRLSFQQVGWSQMELWQESSSEGDPS